MERLRQIVGRERSLHEVAQALLFATHELEAAHVGALHVTCADESEHECAEAFQHGFVRYKLPPLKFAQASAFRVANLGGRYEWSAVRLAEDHFATPLAASGFKLLVAKINAHVAFEEHTGEHEEKRFRFGVWERYGRESTGCGALAALLDGAHGPAIDELRETFQSEGKDRIGRLTDPEQVPPEYRPLFASMISARLQARKCVLDVQDYRGFDPTIFLIVPSVTINRHERDTEIVCGFYSMDYRKSNGAEPTWFGLGDDPSAYRLERVNRRFIVTDDQLGGPRRIRDHRTIAREHYLRARADTPLPTSDGRIERIREDVAKDKHRDHRHARMLLRAALPVLAEVAPVPVALLLFAEGAAGIHHAFKIHKIADEMKGEQEARRMLQEIHDQVDRLDPDHAEALIELLVSDYRG